MEQMFERASRLKIRFAYKGLCTTEDLWDVPFTALDAIFKALNAQKKAQTEESLMDNKDSADELLDLQLAIVRRIFDIRREEKKHREEAKLRAMQKEKLLGLIAKKQDEAYEGMSVEDLTKMMNEL